jgi:enoyl-CoA hydratase/carnithine racemase
VVLTVDAANRSHVDDLLRPYGKRFASLAHSCPQARIWGLNRPAPEENVMNAPALHDEAILLRHSVAGVAWLTLGLIAALDAALAGAAADAAVKVVVIAGNGPAFCAGHDLREMRANPGREATESLFAACAALMTRIVRLPKPVIARVHGIATAAGCQLVASCDLAVAADTARFATPGVNIGLFCSTPMVALTRAVGRKAAMEMLLTGEPVDAARARDLGLVNRVVAADQLDASVQALAAQIAAKSPLTLAIGKQLFHAQAELPLDEAYRLAAAAMTRNMLARDAAEGIDAFLHKRAPVWTGT